MGMRIVRNAEGNCINFVGSSNPAYFNACLSATVNALDANAVDVINDIRTANDENTQYEFYSINYTEFLDKDGNAFADAQAAADYINENANVLGLSESGASLTGTDVNFRLDQTSTSIIMDNGSSFGVNTIKAVANEDGTIHIHAIDGGVPSGSEEAGDKKHFEGLEHTRVSVNNAAVSGGLNDVVNTLNELFTVGAFESVVITDPEATTIPDVGGAVDAGTIVGSNAIDPLGDDILGTTATHNNAAGYLSDNTIDQAGEYFTFDIAGKATYGFGLVHTQASYDDGYAQGNQSYADPAGFCVGANSSHYGYQFAHHFHIGNAHASWTNYGANTGYVMGEAWYDHNNRFDKKEEWNAGDPVKVKVGINSNGFIEIATASDTAGEWRLHARSSYPVPEGAEFKLGVKLQTTGARLRTQPKAHLLEPAAPTMYFRYIESPDGNFEYPLFATEDEANYYDSQNGGTGSGSSHTHTYTDDPSGTTWYMPDNGGTMTGTSAPAFDLSLGFSATYTEITSLSNADMAPPQFTATNVTQEEGTNVNIQVTPAGATWSTSASISPSGSGLVFDGGSLIQGTLADVGSDTVYTITVTRGNSYGSTTGSMTVTATDVAPTQTSDTPWTKALDFSGSSERTEMVSGSAAWNPLMMNGASSQIALPATGQTVSSGHPWATACVFKIDGNSSNQHIWNLGEGAGTNDDNIYLRVDSSQRLLFGWGRQGSTNECYIHTLSSAWWYGIYVGFNGARYGAAGSTASRLNDIFDIRLISSIDSFASLSTMPQLMSGWTHGASSTGGRMDRQFTGKLTLGGRGANRNFHGKIASFVSTTLPCGVAMPTDVEIKEMIVDPMGWLYDSKAGNSYRRSNSTSTTSNFVIGSAYGAAATQIWLMGDGVQDSYSNMIRNQVWSGDQNYTKMNMLSMVSNDIQTVNINGLT